MVVVMPAVMVVAHVMAPVMTPHMVMMAMTMANFDDRVGRAHSVGQRRGCGHWAGKPEAGQYGQGK